MKSCHPSFRVLLSCFLLLGLPFVSLSTLATTELVWTLISSILSSPSLLTLCSPSKPPSAWLSEKLFYHVHIPLILLLANFTFSIISPLFWGYNINASECYLRPWVWPTICQNFFLTIPAPIPYIWWTTLDSGHEDYLWLLTMPRFKFSLPSLFLPSLLDFLKFHLSFKSHFK